MRDVKIWGPSVWYFIHKISFDLPQNTFELTMNKRKQLSSFYRVLQFLLPCTTCRHHYGNMLTKYELMKNTETGKKMAKWSVMVHNKVNRRLKKPIVDYPTAIKLYKNIINHNKLHKFIKFILVESDDSSILNRKAIAKHIITLYPCINCKKRMVNFLEYNPLNSINNSKKMTNWAKRLLIIAKKPC